MTVMHLSATALLLGLVVSTSHADSICNCIRTFKPVCGSDGKTYNSGCNLECAAEASPGLSLAYPGACCPPPICPDFKDYVCDSNDVTYENPCFYRYAACIARRKDGIMLRMRSGKCRDDSSSTTPLPTTTIKPPFLETCLSACTSDMEPICDSEGKTHMNPCMFEYSNCMQRRASKPPATVAYEGKCHASTAVDGSNAGRTCATSCEQELISPVCGSDGQTYANECLMRKHACISGKKVTILQHSPCDNATDNTDPIYKNYHFQVNTSAYSSAELLLELEPNQTFTETDDVATSTTQKPLKFSCMITPCPQFHRPVCGTDKNTYANICELKNHACTLLRSGEGNVAMHHHGPCHPKDAPAEITTTTLSPDQVCPESCAEGLIVPVCDQWGKFYSNDCLLKQKSCANRAQGLAGLRVTKCPKIEHSEEDNCNLGCTKIYQPVCDNLGRTHSNRCLFDYEQCIRKQAGINLRIVRKGACIAAIDRIAEVTITEVTTPATTEPKTTLPSIATCVYHCRQVEAPLCDDYGVTHLNPCEFDKAKCLVQARGGPELKIAKRGPCEVADTETIKVDQPISPMETDSAECKFACGSQYDPLCDNTNKTHPNLCVFEYNRCVELQKVPPVNINVAYSGPCSEMPVIWEPKKNISAIQFSSRVNPNIATVKSTDLSDCELNCTSERDEVCDSQGRTHLNLCYFEYAKCQAYQVKGMKIVKKHGGACNLAAFSIESEPTSISRNIDVDASVLRKGDATSKRLTTGTSYVVSSSTLFTLSPTTRRTKEPTRTVTTLNPPIYDVFGPSTYTPPPPINNSTVTIEDISDDQFAQMMEDLSVTVDHRNRSTTSRHPVDLLTPESLSSAEESSSSSRLILTSVPEVDPSCREIQCSDMKDPVCDTDGRTHLNACVFAKMQCNERAANRNTPLEIKHNGECAPALSFSRQTQPHKKVEDKTIMCRPKCSDDYEPICDHSGSTHANMCRFKYISCMEGMIHGEPLQMAHNGACFVPKHRSCDLNCTGAHVAEICAGDGGVFVKSFSNLCSFNVLACRNSQALYIHQFGQCTTKVLPTRDFCLDKCDEILDPVCDHTGKTHANLCEFNKAVCLHHRDTGDQLYLVSRGECSKIRERFPIDECGYVCSQNYAPVCDSRGITHNNLCLFKHAKCEKERSNPSEEIQVIHFGLCADNLDYSAVNPCVDHCAPDPEPVCAADGTTYDNTCEFNRVACVDPSQELAYRGKCGDPPPDGPIALVEAPPLTETRTPLEAWTVPTTSEPALNCAIDCPFERNPLCDNRNQTHTNPCTFKAQRCIHRQREGQPLTFSHIGPCNTESPVFDAATEVCQYRCVPPSTFDTQICDNQGRTHNSVCAFKRMNCQMRTATGTGLEIEKIGPCEDVTKAPVQFGPEAKTTLGQSTLAKTISITPLKTTRAPAKFGPKGKSTFRKAVSPSATLGRTLTQTSVSEVTGAPFQWLTSSVTVPSTPSWQNMCNNDCGDDYSPVCDDMGATHDNLCKFGYASCVNRYKSGRDLNIVRNGPCQPELENPIECEMECTTTFKPVCANNNRTFANLCFFKRNACISKLKNGEPIRLQHFGMCGGDAPTLDSIECPDEADCPKLANPVCDSLGRTHETPCHFNRARCLARRAGNVITIRQYGACQDQMDCPATCTDETQQEVCDNLFRTHTNMCYLKRQQCEDIEHRRNPTQLMFAAPCSDCVRSCGPEYAPVCSTMKSTHPNLCQFAVASCIYFKKFGANLTLAYDGECCDNECIDAVPGGRVCDTKGTTHENECLFEVERCLMHRLHNTEIAIQHKGPCTVADNRSFPRSAAVIDSPVQQLLSAEPTLYVDSDMSLRRSSNCSTDCSDQNVPVCGSDGKTYISSCHLKMLACKEDTRLQVEYTGPCCSRKNETECSDAYEPVCDSRGQTHPNKCYFYLARCESVARDQENIEIAYSGACCQHACLNNYQPVCDSRGRSHQNYCAFDIARCLTRRRDGLSLTVAHVGICQGSGCDRTCPQVYHPLCASDGKTYANQCHLERAQCVADTTGSTLVLRHRGKCCTKDCDSSYEPVCDSEGHTHANLCWFEQSKCNQRARNPQAAPTFVQRRGPCCEQPCDDEYLPVCDTTGHTHKNLCYFRVEQCKLEHRGEGLALRHRGECCRLQTPCLDPFPVCGTDGRTYGNECRLQHHSCMQMKQGQSPTVKAYRGECCQEKECRFPYAPVCDEQLRTHDNLCVFENYKCVYDRTHNNSIVVDHEGPCCKNECAEGGETVCDQNGRSYGNRCLFDFAACREKRITRQMLLATPCPSRLFRN